MTYHTPNIPQNNNVVDMNNVMEIRIQAQTIGYLGFPHNMLNLLSVMDNYSFVSEDKLDKIPFTYLDVPIVF